MTTTTDPLLRSMREWNLWGTLVAELLPPGSHPVNADPVEVEAALMGKSVSDFIRFLHLLVGNGHGDTLEEAAEMLGPVRERLVRGERPLFWGELQ